MTDRTLSPVPGVSYRQLDYWASRGLLHPDNGNPGTGSSRQWSPAELAVAETMGRLVNAGLTVAAAHKVARGTRNLAPGVWILIDDEPVETDDER